MIGLIGVFIGIIFFFFILAARQVAIVCYVVVSPIAFACMMLPNTKRFFDKWWKVGWGLLLVYPICGLLMGGGNFVSRLILSAGTYSETNSVEFVTALAMAASIAPIFFIPEVVSNAMNALPNVLGGLANKISGLGKGISRGTQGAIRGSEGYKTLQKAGYNRKIRIQAGYNKDWKPTALGKGKAMLANTKCGKAIGFQGFLILIVVGIYAVLIQNITISDDVVETMWGVMGYNILLVFSLFKTGTLSKRIFSAQ